MADRDIEGLYRVLRGEGHPLVLVHGSAADAEGWTTQLATLRETFRLLVYDRRGTQRSPLPPGATGWSVLEHAEDLLALARRELGRPVFAAGSSFGAVCLLEAARRDPGAFSGLALIEPPLPESDAAPPVPESFLTELERRRAASGGEAAAAFFLRAVLGRDAYEAMPERWKARALALHEQIVLDSRALADYPPRFDDLSDLRVPTLLLGGGRSAPHFKATLRTLERSLPDATLEIIPSAGHMLHAEVARTFAQHMAALVARAEAER